MKEKIKETVKSAAKAAKSIVAKNSDMFYGAALVGSMIIAYNIGLSAGENSMGQFAGNLLRIYPKDGTVGQFLEDLNKMRG